MVTYLRALINFYHRARQRRNFANYTDEFYTLG